MTYNYRVVKEDDDLRIYDVYYNEQGDPIATHTGPTFVYGETVEDLRVQLQLMLDALDMPVLEMRTIGSKP
jgi:hypothetical protein